MVSHEQLFFSFALLLLWGTLNARLLLHYVTFSFMNRSSAFHPRKCINKYHAYHTKKKCIQVKALVRKLFFLVLLLQKKGILTLSSWKYIAVFGIQKADFYPLYWVKIQNFPLLLGQNPKCPPFLLGQNSKFPPFNWVNIQNSPLFILSKFKN